MQNHFLSPIWDYFCKPLLTSSRSPPCSIRSHTQMNRKGEVRSELDWSGWENEVRKKWWRNKNGNLFLFTKEIGKKNWVDGGLFWEVQIMTRMFCRKYLIQVSPYSLCISVLSLKLFCIVCMLRATWCWGIANHGSWDHVHSRNWIFLELSLLWDLEMKRLKKVVLN